jgi:hypothetical protein
MRGVISRNETYNFHLFAVLSLGHLACTLLVEVCVLDLILEFT